MSKTVVIVQARMGSSRFPGKVLHPLLGQPMLLWHLDRLRQMETPCDVVVASPDTLEDAQIKALCERHGHHCELIAGDQNDVLARYEAVATLYEADTIVRTTADCPLIDPDLIDAMLHAFHLHDTQLDHMGIGEMDPDWPDGVDAEVIRAGALTIADFETTIDWHKEHVTPYLYKNPNRFACATFPCPFQLGHYQWSVDTLEDANYVEQLLWHVVTRWGMDFRTKDLWQVHIAVPELEAMNALRPPRNHAYKEQVARETSLRLVRKTLHIPMGLN